MQIEERLWEYIDGLSDEKERLMIARLLQTDPEWKLKYEELVSVHQLLNSSELEVPSMRFSQNVMEEIGKLHIAPAMKTYINKKVIYGIGGFFITMIVGLLVYTFAQVNWTAGTDNVVVSKITRVDWSRTMNSTYFSIFMMVNLVLCLMLLDKYLESKKQTIKTGRRSF